jgi:hypothetical protein
MVSFFIYIILPAALWPWGWLSLQETRVPRTFPLGSRVPVPSADNLINFMSRLSRNLGASASWNPLGLAISQYGDRFNFQQLSLQNIKLLHVKHNVLHFYIQPSSWRWTLEFEKCRRYYKLKYWFKKGAFCWSICCNYIAMHGTKHIKLDKICCPLTQNNQAFGWEPGAEVIVKSR